MAHNHAKKTSQNIVFQKNLNLNRTSHQNKMSRSAPYKANELVLHLLSLNISTMINCYSDDVQIIPRKILCWERGDHLTRFTQKILCSYLLKGFTLKKVFFSCTWKYSIEKETHQNEISSIWWLIGFFSQHVPLFCSFLSRNLKLLFGLGILENILLKYLLLTMAFFISSKIKVLKKE